MSNRVQSKAQKAIDLDAERRFAMMRKYRDVFESADGQIVLNDIVNRICGANQTIMSTNPMAVYIQGTRRDVADSIRRMIDGVSEPKRNDE